MYIRLTATAAADDSQPDGPRAHTALSSITEVFPVEFIDALLTDPGLSTTDFCQVNVVDVAAATTPRPSTLRATASSVHAQVKADVVQFKVRCINTAAFVLLETPLRGRFSDNGICITPWQPATVSFLSKDTISCDDLRRSMTFQAVNDDILELD